MASLQRGKTSPTSTLDMTQKSDDEASIILELWVMLSNLLLPSILGPLWAGVVAPDRVLFMGQIELNCVLKLN